MQWLICIFMTITREPSVKSWSGSTEEAIKGLKSRSLGELREKLTFAREIETISTSKPASVMTINGKKNPKKQVQ